MRKVFSRAAVAPELSNEVQERSHEPAELLALLREKTPTEQYLKAILGELSRLYEHCRARKDFYHCQGEVEQAVRFENAARTGIAFVTSAQVAFMYEREQAAKSAMEKEIEAARAYFPTQGSS